MWILIFIVPLFVWIDIRLFMLFYGLIFSGKEDFNNSVKYSITPDLFSLFKGEYHKDRIGEFKLGIFIGLCIITLTIEIWVASKLVGLLV